MEPIRVLMINYKMQCAGIESFIMNMYRNIDRSKVQFDFLVHYTEKQFYDDEIVALGGRIYRLSIREDNDFFKYFKDLDDFFEKHPEYRIVHGHMESFGVFYLRAAQKAGVNIRIAHSHIAQRNKGLKGTIKNILNKGYKLFATDLFACSQVAGEFTFGKNSKFSVYNNAIDVHDFSFDKNKRDIIRAELGLEENTFVIGHVGRFNKQKNHTFLIDIFAEICKLERNTILLLSGEGDLKDSIEQKVKELGLNDKVLYLGIRRDMNMIYQGMDVFVMPSLFEGLPVSGIEAQASGLKCILSDTITKQTNITNNVEFISLNEKPDFWAKKIIAWNKSYDRENQAKKIIDAGYDIKTQAKRLENFYLNKSKTKE